MTKTAIKIVHSLNPPSPPFTKGGRGGINESELRTPNSELRILGTLKETENEFRASGIQNPRLDAEALLSFTLGIDRTGLYSEYDRILTEEEIDRFLGMAERRMRKEPLQYILGTTEFYGLEFIVTQDVLIPRPETELLAEEAIKIVQSSKLKVKSNDREKNSELRTQHFELNILDLCTGSGCIAAALAKEFPDVTIYATDMSGKALRIAKENARRNRVDERIIFIEGDLFEPFSPSPKSPPLRAMALREEGWSGGFNLIVSNPPYIPGNEIDSLQKEVSDYEPGEALDGGPDGLFYIRKIIGEAPFYLRSCGVLILEIGQGQKDEAYRMAEMQGAYGSPEVIKDFAGIERVIVLQRK